MITRKLAPFTSWVKNHSAFTRELDVEAAIFNGDIAIGRVKEVA
jgi:hypothetical protein